MGLLCRLDPDTPELKNHRDVLIGKRLELNNESLKLIEAERAKGNIALREAWEAQKKLCREQQGRIDALNSELATVTREFNAATEKKAKAEMRVFDAHQRRKELSRFATAEQTAKSDGAILKAQEAFEEAGVPESEYRQRRNDLILVSIPRAQRDLNELAAREIGLRSAITGEGYTDGLGIIHPPRSPLA